MEQHLEAKSERLSTSSSSSVALASGNFALNLSANLKHHFYVRFYQMYFVHICSAK